MGAGDTSRPSRTSSARTRPRWRRGARAALRVPPPALSRWRTRAAPGAPGLAPERGGRGPGAADLAVRGRVLDEPIQLQATRKERARRWMSVERVGAQGERRHFLAAGDSGERRRHNDLGQAGGGELYQAALSFHAATDEL